MTRAASLLLAILFLSACITNEPEDRSASNEAEVQAVQQAVEDWLNVGVASLDTTIIGSYMTPTFGLMEPHWRDRTGFLKWVLTFEEDFGGPFTISYSFSDWHTTVEGDIAWTSMFNDGTLIVEGNEPRHMQWTETGVLLKQPDGRWLVDRYHSTYLGDKETE